MGKRRSASQDWRGRWYNIELNLRPQYKDFEAYKAAYFKTDRKQKIYQEDGMEAFAKLEKSLLRRARYACYEAAGQKALGDFTSASINRHITSAADLVFVAIDFEGRPKVDKPYADFSAFGTANLDTRDIIGQQTSLSQQSIKCEHYRLRQRTLGGFLFGQTTRIDRAQLRSAVLDSLRILDPSMASPRRVVLVGHGITHSESGLLELLDISLENSLPNVVGIVDTERLSKTLQNCTGSLGQLLKRLQVSFPQRSLHCAGNDACFALKAMIGLLQLRHPGLLDELDELKLLHPVAAPLESSKREETENSDDWLNNLDGDYCSILD